MRRILADVDTGIDDAIALLHLAGHPQVDLVGVTTTSGNTTAAQAAANSAAVLAIAGRLDVPVRAGSPTPLVIPLVTAPETHGPTGLGYAQLPAGQVDDGDWLELWLDELHTNPGQTTILVTGPMTNLAHALDAEPKLGELAAGIVIMGGAIYHPGNTDTTAEFNVRTDPHAAARVLASFDGAPVARLPRLATLGVTEQATITPRDLDALALACGARAPHLDADLPRTTTPADLGQPVINLVCDALRFYFEFHLDWDGVYLAMLHDLLAAQIAAGDIKPTLTPTWVGVETQSPLTLGLTIADLRGRLGRQPNTALIGPVDREAVIAALTSSLRRLTAETGG